MEGQDLRFSQYDVLVHPPVPGVCSEYSLTQHESHVGNKRFQVLLTMKREAYGNAQKRGDMEECNRAVDNLVDTVCNQVVPPGRFLESKSVVVGNAMPVLQWHPMDESAVKSLLHKVLNNEKAAGTQAGISSLEEAAASVRFSLERNQLSDNDGPTLPPPPFPRNDDGQKRRRRSSLLRRSNSESMVGMVLDNRKKLNFNAGDLRGGTQEEPASWKSASCHDQLHRMDVVLTQARDALDPSCTSVGNNRLHILLAVRSGQFSGGTIDAQEKVLDELVETVCTFWKGRFLVECEGGYEEIPKGEGREALRIIFSGKTTDNGSAFPLEGRRQRHSDPVGGFSAIGMLNGSNMGAGGMGPPAAKSSMSNARQAFTALPSSLTEDAHKNQNRALKCLKKQQARNQNAYRLQERLGVATSKPTNKYSGGNLPLFPIGGMVHPSMPNAAPSGNINSAPSVSGRSVSSHQRAAPRKNSMLNPRRESTVFSKLGSSVMEDLVASLDDADCNDDIDEPLPSDSNLFGNQFDGGTPGGPQH